MKRPTILVTLLTCISFPGFVAACPDFLNHSMRALGSTERIQFCEAYEGKALLIVNTASYCGYTPQFEGLEQLHQTYQSAGLAVVGFSSDDFWQEDNDEEDAADVCFEKYSVSFPVMATSAVKGKDANPIFRGLGEAAGYPRWNFNKYLVSPNGDVLAHFGSGVTPGSEEMTAAIEEALPSPQR